MADTTVNVSADRARSWATTALQTVGVPAEHAAVVARALVLADLRGTDSHGLSRLPGYIERVQTKSVNPSPNFSFVQKSPVMGVIDAQDTFGFVSAHLAVEQAVSMADTYGVGIVGVKNSGHFGAGAPHCLQAMEKGFAALCFTNSSPAIPAWGSKQPLWGTNPMAVGFPGGANGDFLLDMSASIVAMSKVRRAARRGESISESWMLDSQGRPTTDPTEALKGTILPIGGPKGAGLAAMIDIFSGLLTGASFGGAVKSRLVDPDKQPGTGHWFMVFKPEMFLDSKEEYLERMDTLMANIRGSEKAEGVTEVFAPGERSARTQKERETAGIPYREADIKTYHEMAERVGCDARLV